MIWIWKIQGMLVSCRIRLHCAAARQEEHLSFLCRGTWGGRCGHQHIRIRTSQTYSVVTERHWRHCLRVWTLWPSGVVWPFLCYLPGLYSSKPSRAFLRIHQLKLQRSSALTLNSPGSVCCKCLCCVATIPYVRGLLIGKLMSWIWLLKTCCTGKAAQRAVEWPTCACVPSPAQRSLFFHRPCENWWVYAMKEKVLWDGLAASRLFCPKYSLPCLIKS